MLSTQEGLNTREDMSESRKKYLPRYVKKASPDKNFWLIFIKCIGWLLLGAAAGYVFYYYFSDFTVAAVDRYKFLQSIFGISHYEQGGQYLNVLFTILTANIVSTAAYFALGYFKFLIPLGLISGFFMTLMLFAGAAKRGIAIPVEVMVLFAVEALYRCLALSAGEHLYYNRLAKKHVFITSIIIIFMLLISAAFYEIYQIFGYIF